MRKAYESFESLPESRRAELDGLKTVNKIEDKAYVSAEDKRKYGAPQTHPLIRTHPETGAKAIFIHRGKVARIEGRTPEDSSAFVNALMEQVIQPDVAARQFGAVGQPRHHASGTPGLRPNRRPGSCTGFRPKTTNLIRRLSRAIWRSRPNRFGRLRSPRHRPRGHVRR